MKAFTRAALGRKREEDVLKNQGGEFREKGRVGISRIPPQQARERSRRWELGDECGKWPWVGRKRRVKGVEKPACRLAGRKGEKAKRGR